MTKLKLVIGSDHAGYNHAKNLYSYLLSKDYEVLHLGAMSCSQAYDYPDVAKEVATLIKNKRCDYGILLCGSGIGVSIQANRYSKVRAALCNSKEFAALAREHNDANVLCLPARFMSLETAIECVHVFLNTPFLNNDKYIRRVNKMDNNC